MSSISSPLKALTLAYLANSTSATPFISSDLIPISLNPTTPTLNSDCTQLSNSDISIVWRQGESTITKLFSSTLNPISSQQTCSQNTTNYQPKNQALSDGGYINVWFAIENDQWKIVFQRFDKKNNKLGPIQQAFPSISDKQANAAITKLLDGKIIIACTIGQYPISPSKKGPGIIYQAFTPTMDPIPSFKGDAYGPNLGEHFDAALSPSPDGGFDITFSASGKILTQHITATNKKNSPVQTLQSAPSNFYYHPSAAPLVDGSIVTWAKTTPTTDQIVSYEYTQLLPNDTNATAQTFKTAPPSIEWTKIWIVFQSYLKALPDPFGGFTLLGRVNNSIVQQHFYSLLNPSGPITTIVSGQDPNLQISGCPTKNGWINLISNTTGLYAQQNTFIPTPHPSTKEPTPAPTPLPSTKQPTPAPSPMPSTTSTPAPTSIWPTPAPPEPNKINPAPVNTLFIVMMSIMACTLSLGGGCISYVRYRYRRGYDIY